MANRKRPIEISEKELFAMKGRYFMLGRPRNCLFIKVDEIEILDDCFITTGPTLFVDDKDPDKPEDSFASVGHENTYVPLGWRVNGKLLLDAHWVEKSESYVRNYLDKLDPLEFMNECKENFGLTD